MPVCLVTVSFLRCSELRNRVFVMGGGWRMPTAGEMEELTDFDITSQSWSSRQGVVG